MAFVIVYLKQIYLQLVILDISSCHLLNQKPVFSIDNRFSLFNYNVVVIIGAAKRLSKGMLRLNLKKVKRVISSYI